MLQYATVLVISICEACYYCVGNNYVKVVDIVRPYHTDIQVSDYKVICTYMLVWLCDFLLSINVLMLVVYSGI